MPQIGEVQSGVWLASGFGAMESTPAIAGELIARAIVDRTDLAGFLLELVWARLGRARRSRPSCRPACREVIAANLARRREALAPSGTRSDGPGDARGAHGFARRRPTAWSSGAPSRRRRAGRAPTRRSTRRARCRQRRQAGAAAAIRAGVVAPAFQFEQQAREDWPPAPGVSHRPRAAPEGEALEQVHVLLVLR